MTSAILLVLAQFSTLGAPRPADPSRPQSDVPVTVTIRVAEGRQFRPGEIIRIELEFSSAIRKRFVVDGATYDRSGRLTIDEFRIDRVDAVTDPMLDYFAASGGYIGGGLRGMGVLGDQPFIVKLELNDWFRFDQPGTFRLSVRSERVVDDAAATRTIVPVESNALSFEIVPSDAGWEATELDAARQILDKGSPIDRKNGCRMMRFLGTDAAVNEMIQRYGRNIDLGCEFEYMAGLFSAPNREHVVRQMETGLRAADQPVTASYLQTLATLSVYLEHPEFRPAQRREEKGRLVAGGEMTRHRDLIEAASAHYADILTAALPDKTDRARAITLAERQGTLAPSSSAAESTTTREQLATAFLGLPVERQTSLLGFQWPTIASPAMIPVLRQLVESSPTTSESVPDLALRRLNQLAPDDARPLMLREIQNPRQGSTLKTLGRLPDEELPELDEVLAANFEAGADLEARGDFEDAGVRAELVHRYASRHIADRILQSAIERLPRMACRPQSAILAYFVRVADGIGTTLIDRARSSSRTGCRTSLAAVAELRMTPMLEARAIADLEDSDPDVVIAAIETLGRHGSPAAHGPLRVAFEGWHAIWDGRASELQYSYAADRPHVRQAMVEDAFRQALGGGRVSLARRDELRELRALCVTDSCRTQIGIMIDRADDTRIAILRVDEPGDSLIQLAQYQFQSMLAFEQKLAQYPSGTSFTLDVGALDSQMAGEIVARIRTFAASHGIAVNQAIP